MVRLLIKIYDKTVSFQYLTCENEKIKNKLNFKKLNFCTEPKKLAILMKNLVNSKRSRVNIKKHLTLTKKTSSEDAFKNQFLELL